VISFEKHFQAFADRDTQSPYPVRIGDLPLPIRWKLLKHHTSLLAWGYA
jgi:hypothetical protein